MIEQAIDIDIRRAMIGRLELRLEALRTIKTAIQIEKAKEGKDLNDEQILKLIQKLVSQRTESARQYNDGGRPELVEHEQYLITVFKEFLPEQLSEDKIESEVKKIIAEIGATSVKDMGKVMAKANQTFAGKADNKLVGTIVKNLLTQ